MRSISSSALINPRGVVRHILANMWQLRRRDGPVNPHRVEVPDPLMMSARIKEKAGSSAPTSWGSRP